MQLADAHIHLFSRDDLAAYEQGGLPTGVEAALLVGYEGHPAYRGNNDLVLALARSRSTCPQLAPLAFVPVTAPEPDRLAGLGGGEFRGVSLYVTDEQTADLLAGWSDAAVVAVAAHCPIVNVDVRSHLVPRVAKVLAEFAPDTVLLSHLGLPGRLAAVTTATEVAAAIGPVLDLAEHEHIGVKLSAYLRHHRATASLSARGGAAVRRCATGTVRPATGLLGLGLPAGVGLCQLRPGRGLLPAARPQQHRPRRCHRRQPAGVAGPDLDGRPSWRARPTEGSRLSRNVVRFAEVGLCDVESVGGKNASLGEMVQHLARAGVRVPDGFATTADAYRRFLAAGGLGERINARLAGLDVDDTRQLTGIGAQIRSEVEHQAFPDDLDADIRSAFAELCGGDGDATFAVRSSATAEDLPDASFAGQQETFLNVAGIEAVLRAIRLVFASLYNDRAIAYRVHGRFDHAAVALSAGVQRMVRSDVGASGVMFTMDTESGFRDAVFITSSYGLGEAVVQGAVNPDEFYVYKPALRAGRPAILRRNVGSKATKMVYAADSAVGRSTKFVAVPHVERRRLSITDDDVTELSLHALRIEEHYGRPMDIEWAKDGRDGGIYILQARPETVQSRQAAATTTRFTLHAGGSVLVDGRAVGQRIGAGAVRVLRSVESMHDFRPGEVLVADMTDPDWEPIMKRASAIVTDRGGRTCHAAIIARELGIPAVVGTANATSVLVDGQQVTVSCAEGDTGLVYAGLLDFDRSDTVLDDLPDLPVKLMLNVGSPEQAFEFARLPNRGVGLARLEFIIARQIGVHPRALLELDHQPEPLKREIAERTAAYPGPRAFFVQRVIEGVSTIAAAFAPRPVVVRMSDFKSNEYAGLLGGAHYEPREQNPMLGYRGAARYLSPEFTDCFAMECEALKYVRDDMGLTNVRIMIPFVRTADEAAAVIDLLSRNGLRRGENGLEVFMMCELPSNALNAHRFLDHFDGFSIGSNDLTQLTLGLDRDSAVVACSFDERDPAVTTLLEMAIRACGERGKYVGICGQGPSDHPDLAEWLLEHGIESISLNPDTVVDTWIRLADAHPLGDADRVGVR